DAGKIDGELNGRRVEVDRVIVKLLEIRAGRAWDVGTALAERFISTVEAFRKVRNSPAEVPEHPLNAGEALRDAAENEFSGSERGVHEESDQWHEPEICHRFDTDG